MGKARAARNRTLTLSTEEKENYLSRCLRVTEKADLGKIVDKTVNGDAFSVLPLLPANFVDLLIVDPPYNLAKNYNGTGFRKMSDDDYKKYTREWIKSALHVLKPTASVYVCCDWRSGMAIADVLSDYFTLRNRITWQREKGRGALKNWKNAMEDIFFATCSAKYTFNVDDVKLRRRVLAPYRQNGKPKDWEETGDGNFRNTYPSNFWDDISVPYWSMPENTDHPTQKPEKLIAKLILASSKPGDIVLDPFAGSGTTSVVAKKLGRRFLGIETDETYCAWTGKRLEAAENDSLIQGYHDGVFWERNALVRKSRGRAEHLPAASDE